MSTHPALPVVDLKRAFEVEAESLREAVDRALASGWYILGNESRAFEAELAAQLGATGAVGCNSGTDALVLPLLAAGVGPGDEVITVSHTAIPTITAIRSVGATPVFAEIDPETWVMAAGEARRLLTPRTRAIIPVHLYGAMADVPALQAELRAAGREDVAMIEDVAQAQGATWDGRAAGSLARFGAFSFYPTKNLACLGDGGAVCAQREGDLEKLRRLRNYGQSDRYLAAEPRGINSRLDEIQAAILRARLPRLEAQLARRAELLAEYRERLAGLPVRFQRVVTACRPAWHLCVLAFEEVRARDGVAAHLASQGIGTIIHYPRPTHLQPALAGAGAPARLPVTESLAQRILSLPFHAHLTDGERDRVVAAVRGYFA